MKTITAEGVVTDIETMSFQEAREFVGGDVEYIRCFGTKGGFLAANMDGNLRNLPLNLEASLFAGQKIVGNAVHMAKRTDLKNTPKSDLKITDLKGTPQKEKDQAARKTKERAEKKMKDFGKKPEVVEVKEEEKEEGEEGKEPAE